MHRYLWLVILSILVYAGRPATAQVRPGDVGRVTEEIRQTDQSAADAARRWADARNLPLRIRQSDGDFVELVGVSDSRPTYFTTANRLAADVTRTVHLHPGERLGLGLTGGELEIGIWDSGHVLGTHRELTGRVFFGDNSEVTDHATHVAGTLAATGVDVRARGMAFQSRIRSYSWSNDATEMTNESARGMLVSNHSYTVIAGWHFGDLEDEGDKWYWVGDPTVSTTEDYRFGWYDVAAVQFDRVAYTAPYFLPVVAAGNDRADRGPTSGTYRALDSQGNYQTYDVSTRPIPRDGGSSGFDTIAGAGVAKNTLTVGSVGVNAATGNLSLSTFSSFGPTDDGRIKPDLMGLGERLYSSSSSGTSGYSVSSGTSMSTPNVAGSLLLLQEHYRNVYGHFMRAATLKGLVIHTAEDLGPPGPDYRTGWGMLNAEAAAEHVSSAVTNPVAIFEGVLPDGGTFSRDVLVEEPGPVRITLSWTDPPSVRLALLGPESLNDPRPHLRNDLDVRLIRPSSEAVYHPFVLDRTNPDQPARQGDNLVDPLEQIFVAHADTGRYVVTVTHKGRLHLGLAQPFSLLVSGARDDSVPVAIAHLSAVATLDGITLRWTTLFELRPGTFVIERALEQEAAGKGSDAPFVAVGELAATGDGSRDYVFTDTRTISGRYVYRVVHVDGSSRFEAGRTNVNLPPPDQYAVLSNYPNPFQDHTTMIVDLPRTQHVTIEIFDVVGRRVQLLFDGNLRAGRHRFPIDGGNWSSGVYFARVLTPNGAVGHRMVRMQ